jgi:hypothetical protein
MDSQHYILASPRTKSVSPVLPLRVLPSSATIRASLPERAPKKT